MSLTLGAFKRFPKKTFQSARFWGVLIRSEPKTGESKIGESKTGESKIGETKPGQDFHPMDSNPALALKIQGAFCALHYLPLSMFEPETLQRHLTISSFYRL